MMHFNRFFSLFLALLLLFALSLALGSSPISISQLWQGLSLGPQSTEGLASIIWQLRLPRSLAAILAGAGLSVSGLLLQTFFRNPIAGPFVLGISSAAGLGAALWIMGGSLLGLSSFWAASRWGLLAAAASGAAFCLFILLLLAWRLGQRPAHLLLMGLMLGSFTNAFILFLQYFSPKEELQSFIFWSMGDLNRLGWSELALLTPLVFFALFLAFLLAQGLNIWLLGPIEARSLGLNNVRLRWKILLISSLLAGGITAFCGPISFVGMAVPHLARLILGSQRHQILLPFTALLGAVLLLACQILAQLPGLEQLLPINLISSLLGAPFLLFLLLSKPLD
ncbi:iron ABC transporter permease [Saprospira sp. CCB-QB6]|uniref:FecCD family ABC transporter permease n=1 Tax=Saprospira sp. CCB-QB6 TaxID=3023936 RepID=UPI00234A4B4C|nr:iron ABC transporter permease [Saprospira sp. CCB-QB6]WCL82775.1 iron ABC transporter permease [Saprospira sp. CCB-QB6]